MNLPKILREHINRNELIRSNQRLLVAVSGGMDSMVLLQLLLQLRFPLEVAHVNYQLRGEDSNSDEALVKEYCLQHRLEFHVLRPDVKAYADTHRLSTQMAARELRYNWFSELLKKRKLDRVVTAHHADDQSETILLKLLRGSGLSGLSGIRLQTEELIRPLLIFSKEDLQHWANEHRTPFREDSSNQSNDYQRNHLRNKVIPLLKEINPSLSETLGIFGTFMQAHHSFLKHSIQQLNCTFVNPITGFFHINTAKFDKIPGVEIVLYELLQPFNVHPRDIHNMASALHQSGKQFFSSSHSITIARDEIVVAPIDANTAFEMEITGLPFNINTPVGNLHAEFEVRRDKDSGKKHIAFVDADKLVFPLKVRTWQEGDSFQPTGMKGTKKVSDFFIDEKLSLPAKKRIPLLYSGDELVWICNMRMDERFIARPDTRNVVKITYMAGVMDDSVI